MHGAARGAALAGRDQMLGGGPLATTVARTFLRLCGRVPALPAGLHRLRRTRAAIDLGARCAEALPYSWIPPAAAWMNAALTWSAVFSGSR